jgi:hypothetical protein
MSRVRRLAAAGGLVMAATVGVAAPAPAAPLAPVALVQQTVSNVLPNGSYWCWDRYWYQWVPCYLQGYGISVL